MKIKKGSLFRVTEEHLKLIKSVYFYEFGDDAIMCVNQKRPFGDSDIIKSIVTILGKSYTEDKLTGVSYVGDQEAFAWADKILAEASIAIECCCQNLSFELRTYRNTEDYGRKWEPV